MPPRQRPIDRARRRAREDLARAGGELHRGRLAAGLTQRAAGEACAMSHAQVSRIERGALSTASVAQLAALAAVVGLDLRLDLYPGPDPVRDAAQLAVADRFRPRLHRDVGFRTEVPLPEPGDLRAWDGYLSGLRGHADRSGMPVEFESRIDDFQAQTRRLWRKARDAGEPYLVLVVADTRRNRAAIQAAAGAVAEQFPITPRRCLAALAAGEHPGGSALLFL